MGSKTFEGVRFSVYSHDHTPAHAHGRTAGVEVIIDLLPDGDVEQSQREDAVAPLNAKRNVVAKIVRVARENASELHVLWEKTHGGH